MRSRDPSSGPVASTEAPHSLTEPSLQSEEVTLTLRIFITISKLLLEEREAVVAFSGRMSLY